MTRTEVRIEEHERETFHVSGVPVVNVLAKGRGPTEHPTHVGNLRGVPLTNGFFKHRTTVRERLGTREGRGNARKQIRIGNTKDYKALTISKSNMRVKISLHCCIKKLEDSKE